jgi:antitoxin MazE
MRVMETNIVTIGDSRGVLIPNSLIKEAGLDGEVELRLVESGILITSPLNEELSKPRAGWAEEAKLAAERGDDILLWENPDRWVWE